MERLVVSIHRGMTKQKYNIGKKAPRMRIRIGGGRGMH